MNSIENLIQIVETKKSDYMNLEAELVAIGICDGVVKRELTNAVNLLDWVLRVAHQNEPKEELTGQCLSCKYKDVDNRSKPCIDCDITGKMWEAK